MNKVFLVGNLTNDPVAKQTSTGKSMSTFSIAINEKLNNQNRTMFIPCKAWDRRADFINAYLKKGDTVVIDGKLDRRSYTNKEGKNVYVTEVIVEQIKPVRTKGRVGEQKTDENAKAEEELVSVNENFDVNQDVKEPSNEGKTLSKASNEDTLDWINEEEK